MPTARVVREIAIPDAITVGELAQKMAQAAPQESGAQRQESERHDEGGQQNRGDVRDDGERADAMEILGHQRQHSQLKGN